jgi:DNA-directed RNA polymerase beta subunit
LARVGVLVERNDVLVSVKKLSGCGEAEALLYHTNDNVMRVKNVETVRNEKGDCVVKIELIEVLTTSIGDKFSSRHGQKGTVGMRVSCVDLPFDEQGITPDVLINPLCIPSRMTIGHMIEMASGQDGCERPLRKYCNVCVKYKEQLKSRCVNDCVLSETIEKYLYDTSFYNRLIPEHVRAYKMKRYYCGATGEPYEALMYSGVIYYQRLKHISKDKIYVRTLGANQTITRQPKEGRSVDGGHRFGVQERDACIALGCAYTLRERLFLSSDYFKVNVCVDCGLLYHGLTQNPRCKCCDSRHIITIELPFSSKVFVQYVAGLNINMRLQSKVINSAPMLAHNF